MNETLKRTLSGVVYIALLISSILYSPFTFFALFGVFMLIAVYEFCSLVKIKSILPLILSTVFYCLLYQFQAPKIIDLVLLTSSIFVSIKCINFMFGNKNSIDKISKYIYLIGYVVLPFIIISKITIVNNVYHSKEIISILILIWTNDTFAYIVGKSIGKTKLLERISPKKTIEGFVGGFIFTCIASFLISEYYVPVTMNVWTITATVVVVFSTLGDLVESKFKRVAGVKDSGKIMPGHGGILDRLDSVIFVAPIIYLFYQILSYV